MPLTERSVGLRALGVFTPGDSSRRLGLGLVGLALFAYFGIRYDHFVSSDNLIATSLNVSSIALAAVGTMALLISGNVDLSIGSQYALVAVVTAWVVRESSNPILGVLTALGLGALLGLVNGLLVTWLRISPLIVTLGTLAIYRGLAFVVGDGVSVYGFPDSFVAIGRTRWLGVPVPVLIALAVFVGGGWCLLATTSGLRLYAIGGNTESARLVGLPVNRLVPATFMLNGMLVGLVALLTTARLGSGAPNFGIQFEMAVLTAVILGGVAFNGGSGHPIGVLTGVCTIGILDAGLIFAGLQDWYQEIARGSLLLLALISDQLLLTVRSRRTGRHTTASKAVTAPPDVATGAQARRIGDVVLSASQLTVTYDNNTVLFDAGLTVRRGEVVCVVGDNGAGKSTMIKALCGVVRTSGGTIELDGQGVDFHTPADARRAGIETVFQGLALCENLGVAHNLVLGEEPHQRIAGVLPMRDDRRAATIAAERLASLGVEVSDLNRPVAQLSGGQRQSVAISRVLRSDVKVIILDEPTAALGVKQTAEVLRLVREVAGAGHGVILISHDVEDIFDVADRVVVLQLGRVIFDGAIAELSRLDLLRLMSGRGAHQPDPALNGFVHADATSLEGAASAAT